jgi:glycerophosphoryl diester phosphodiesterase
MVMIIGHRGARNLWPENSLAGFERTREFGVDGVEFDVHLARDGEMVVIHDPSLERTTEGTGAVADRTAAELAATRLRDGDGAGVPSLEVVLDIYADAPVELHIEIKTDTLGRPYKGLEEKLVNLIVRRGLQQQVVLTCFVPEVLEKVRRLSPHQRVLGSLDRRSAELMGGLPGALDRFGRMDGCLVAVEKGLLADSLDLCLKRLGGSRLGVWVANEADDIAFWLARPIRQITTDRPDIALAKKSTYL